jgi:hypothetical protein
MNFCLCFEEVSMPNNTYFFDFLTQLRGHDKSKKELFLI